MTVQNPEQLLEAAMLEGGSRLRDLARFYIDGSLPPGETLETICNDLSVVDSTRRSMVSLVLASGRDELDEWSSGALHIGAKYLGSLREIDRGQFVHRVERALRDGGSVPRAAKILGVSPRQMARYKADLNLPTDHPPFVVSMSDDGEGEAIIGVFDDLDAAKLVADCGAYDRYDEHHIRSFTETVCVFHMHQRMDYGTGKFSNWVLDATPAIR